MKLITLEELVDFLQSAEITGSTDHGHTIMHVGKTHAGHRFVIVNDCFGQTCLSVSI